MTQKPIQLEVKRSTAGASSVLDLFDSYSFDRSFLTPASPFRFTAPGLEKYQRTAIRSGDSVTLVAFDGAGNRVPLGSGIIDETDTHVTPTRVEFVLSGRDPLGQLVDNAAVDANNKIRNTSNLTLASIASFLVQNTRIPPTILLQQAPNGVKLFNTNPGETKINALQRYLELTNCLAWCQANGQLVIGKPNFAQAPMGTLRCSSINPSFNNVLEARARRNVNQAIRQIVTQLQTLERVDAGAFTNYNADPDMRALKGTGVGRSVFSTFSFGSGADRANQVTSVGTQVGVPKSIGQDYSLREIARDNMKILEVDMVVEGHLNDAGQPFNIDQVYNVIVDDDDVAENMMVHHCSYELTPDHGLMTRLSLCRLGTIVAGAAAVRTSK